MLRAARVSGVQCSNECVQKAGVQLPVFESRCSDEHCDTSAGAYRAHKDKWPVPYVIIIIGIGLQDKSLHLVLLSILPIDVTSDTCLFSLETRNHENEIII